MAILKQLEQLRRLNRNLVNEQNRIAAICQKEADLASEAAEYGYRAAHSSSIDSALSHIDDVQRASSRLSNCMAERATASGRVAEIQEQMARIQAKITEVYDLRFERQETVMRELQETTSKLLKKELLPIQKSMQEGHTDEYDAFISHAAEDKAEVADELNSALVAKGFTVWYDSARLSIGDSLRRTIDDGLIRSKFGIVILSPAFFDKAWTQYELDGLINKELGEERKKIVLPVWHKISKREVAMRSLSLADKFALNTAQYTPEQIACEIAEILKA